MPRGSVSRRLALALQEARRRNLAAAGEPPPVPRSAVGYTRRHLIRAAAALAGGAAIPALAKADPRIVIVGGGVAGLNAAYQLKKRGLNATVYEARDRLGGRMYSLAGAVEPGLVDDIGGSLVNTDHPDMLALVKDFGLKLFDRKADYSPPGRRRSPTSLRAASCPSRAGRRAAPAGRRRDPRYSDLVDKDFDRYGVRFDRMTAAEYFDREAETPLVRSLVEQTIRTEYGVEPGQSSALQFLFLLPTVRGKRVDILAYSDEEFVVEGGSGRVIDGLAAALHGPVTGAPLHRLAADGDGYRLQLGDREVSADYVVLALPFMTLRDVDVQAPLPPLLRQCISQLDLGRDEKLFAGFSRKPWHRPDGFAMDFWTDADFAEAWDDTQRQPDRGRGVLNFFPGGAQVDRLFAESAKAAGHRYLAILDRAFRAPRPPLPAVSCGPPGAASATPVAATPACARPVHPLRALPLGREPARVRAPGGTRRQPRLRRRAHQRRVVRLHAGRRPDRPARRGVDPAQPRGLRRGTAGMGTEKARTGCLPSYQ